jgi:glycosyltransferase involved in cell wall biosynthesis
MISAVILTKNEEKNITDCIQSVLWCDDIIVIDDHSTDKTVELAKSAGAVVYFHDLANDFSAQRNFGIEKARGDWVLCIDADERITDELKKEIQEVIISRRNRYAGYILKRYDVLWGKTLHHGESAGIKLVRLGRKEAGKWVGPVHETWKLNGHIGELKSPLSHYPHKTVREFLTKINFYTDLRAEELYASKIKSTWWSIILYTKGKFFQNYILKRGFLDGIPGIISALMMCFHSFLVRSKLWLLWHKT